MQREQYASKNFGKGLLVHSLTARPGIGSDSPGLNPQKTPFKESKERFSPSTEFIVTPETFGSTDVSDAKEIRYEIVLLLHETCYSRVYSFLRRSVPADVADDLAQETFLRLLSIKKIERMSISISYLFRIAQNLLRRRHNRLVRSQQHLHDKLKQQQASERQTKTADVDTFEVNSDELVRAIGQLSPNERDVIKLIVCQGLSYSAAAKVMGVPVSTVNNWKFRALSRLREFIRTDHGVELDVPQQSEQRKCKSDLRRDSLGSSVKQGASQSESHHDHRIEISAESRAVDFSARAAG